MRGERSVAGYGSSENKLKSYVGLRRWLEREQNVVMKDATKPSIVRWIHLVFSIPILGYIYSPFEKLPGYAPQTRFVFVPVMIVSGLWMWKGHVVRRLISRGSG
jgi:hypothetical protein